MAEILLASVAGADPALLVVFALFLSFGEAAVGIDLLIPGEAGMVVVGAAGSRSGTALWPLIVAGAVGAAAGDSVSYGLGRHFGLRLAHRWAFTRRHLEPALVAAEHRFARHGGLAVAGARWIGALRAVVPAVAGAAKMPFGTFLAWNAPSAAAWAATTITLGALFGEMIVDFVDRTGLWLSVAAVAVLFVLAIRRWRHRTHAPTGTVVASGSLAARDGSTS